jgi:ABC-type branched-subunit amino acid transport system substrate-binding protein
VGPLFSEPAERMAQLAEEYRIPMIAPLANSDELNLDYNYTFQLNPTFEIHGKEMARFAVEELELDSIAIITDSQSLGRASALSFRYEAEKLGAHISYYFEDDLASVGYDLSAFTEAFTPDSTLIDSLGYTPSQAIYAPFTGQAATTLSNLLLNDLEAMRSDVIILGSEEWANADMSAYQRRIFEIYYTQALGQAADSSAVEFFQQDFETRFGFTPDNFASIGYDAANYLFQSLETAGNPIYLDRVLRTRSPYNGLSIKIDFDGNRVNQHLNVHPLTGKAEEKMEEMELTNAND